MPSSTASNFLTLLRTLPCPFCPYWNPESTKSGERDQEGKESKNTHVGTSPKQKQDLVQSGLQRSETVKREGSHTICTMVQEKYPILDLGVCVYDWMKEGEKDQEELRKGPLRSPFPLALRNILWLLVFLRSPKQILYSFQTQPRRKHAKESGKIKGKKETDKNEEIINRF